MSRLVAVFGAVKARDTSEGVTVRGYTVVVSFQQEVDDLPAQESADQRIASPVTASVPVGIDGSFRLEVRSLSDPTGLIQVRAYSPDRQDMAEVFVPLADLNLPVLLEVEGTRPFIISSPAEPTQERLTIQGRAIDTKGQPIPPGLGIVLFGLDQVQNGQPGPPRVVATGRTQSGGYFSLPWVPDPFQSAFARIQGGAAIPVRLQDAGILPRKVVLVGEAPSAPTNGNGKPSPPRAPEPIDLVTNPAAFSQDIEGGCVNLSMPDRTIEEFSYFKVVRTSEPEVIGFSLGQRSTVPPNLLGELVLAAATENLLTARAVPGQSLESLRGLTLDISSAERLLRGDRPPTLQALAKASWLSELDRAKDLLGASLDPPPVRTEVNDQNPIRWDYNETKIYQAVTIAHGHILQYREVWRADGYSLGDLLSSLPLAPGQRRQIAIVDWDRRSQVSREESLEFEEELQSTVSRDRDIREIVGSHLSEEMEAGSRNTTWGAAGGFGAGLISGAFGIFGGVAGGASGSSSKSWQDASRQFSADTLQSLRDRVTQRSSSLRDQRATVVQTVAQGETWRAETEVVANYNRCHTITVEYFQVLRHFVVTHEFAGVRECLFVPFPMRMFDSGRALRWRESLELFLRDKQLLPGFAALERVADQWEGWDYPESRYSEEAPESLEGELRISFVLPRPRDDKDEKYQISEWRPYAPFIPQDTLELWISTMSQRAARERDEYFRRNIAPGIAASFIGSLEFAYVTSSGSTADLTMDGTLVSRYAEGTPLYVTLRPAGGLPPIPREQIIAFQIRYNGGDLPEDARVIVHSGKLRYQTPHLTALLFNEPRILNDLRPGDPVTISTPLSRAESRNPREEDRELGDRLVRHLNENLEFYHQALWADLDTECRFLLLDGMLIPGADGLSVASVVENRLIGIAGNSMIFPLAPGIRLDPRIDDKSAPLRDLYSSNPPAPLNIAIPTRGVYAEAVQGNCTACEKIDDSRYWRWTTSGLAAPPPIAPVTTQRPASTDPDLTPTPLPAPLVSIQNAPELPNPTSIGSILGLLSKPELFRDITGLAGTQANAQKAFSSAMTNMTAIGNDAAALAKQQLALPNTQKTLDRLESAVNDGLLTPEQAQEFAEEAIRAAIGDPKAAPLPTEDAAAKKVIEAASQSKQAEIKVSAPGESVEAKFEDKQTKIGSAPAVGSMEISGLIDQPFTVDLIKTHKAPAGARTMIAVRIPRYEDAKVVARNSVNAQIDGVFPLEDVDPKFVKQDGAGYKVFRRLQIVFPKDTTGPAKVAGTGRLPIVAMIHGHHAHWAQKAPQDFPNHQGFTYLQAHLAEQGIVSVSVDTNAANYINSYLEMRADMLLEGLDRLRLADRDSSSPLFGRLDFNRVGIMGHSRGGDAVVRAALKNNARGANKHGIVAVCSISPSDLTGTANIVGFANDIRTFEPDKIPDVFQDEPNTLRDDRLTYLVVYGGLDADVDGRDGAEGWPGSGFRHYDRATCPKAMVFLHHCNHNRFNEVWKGDTTGRDELGIRPSDLGQVGGTPGRLLSPADHRNLAIDYVGGFFRWKLKNDAAQSGLFTGAVANRTKAAVSLQWSFGGLVKDVEDMENPAQGQIGVRQISNATIDEFGALKINGTAQKSRTQHQTKVLMVNPNLAAGQAVLRLQFAGVHQDWSQFSALLLRVTADFDLTSLDTIANGVLPEFDVQLRDGSPTPVSVAVDQSRFTPTLTRPVFHEIQDVNKDGTVKQVIPVTINKLDTARVALSEFAGLDLKRIVQLEIRPGANFPRHLFFDSLQLVKEKI